MRGCLSKTAVATMLAGFVTFLVAFSAMSQRKDEVLVTIDADVRHQRVDGFGSSFGGFANFERGHFDEVVPYGVSYKMPAELRRKLVRIAIQELGVSHLRMWIGRGVEEQNDNDDPRAMNWAAFRWEGDSQLPQSKDFRQNRQNGISEWEDFLGQAVPLGLATWITTPGGMPAWLEAMIRNNDPNRFEEYAEWAAAHLLYLKRAGSEAPYWSMFNEPDVSRRNWKSAEMWIPWIRATGRRFRKEGLRTKIMFPDNAGVFDAVTMAESVLKDAEVREYVGALAYHHYRSSGRGPQPWLELASQADHRGELFEKLTSGIRGMANLGRQYRLPSWQTETGYYPDYTRKLSEWDVGMGRANEVHYEMVNGASAVEAMSLLAPDAIDSRYDASVRHEGHHIVLRTDGQRVVYWAVTPDTGGVLAQWARFVRPGDIRIEASSSDSAVRVTAFQSEKDRRLVAVLINNGQGPRTAELRLLHPAQGFSAAAAFMTDSRHIVSDSRISIEPRTGIALVPLPARSITTMVWARDTVARPRFQTSGIDAETFRAFQYDHRRFVDISTRERSGEPVSRDELGYIETASAWREELNEIHRTQNPPRESTGLVPLTELGRRKYKGYEGGLHPPGSVDAPRSHLKAGLVFGREIVPRDRAGRPSPDGAIVLLSVGMSNATMEFQAFKRIADADPEKNPALLIVDGAQGAHTAELTADPSHNYWKVVDQRLAGAGVTPEQVQVAWIKQGGPWDVRPFPQGPRRLQQLLAATLRVMAGRFPNLKLAYLSSRTYGGYAETALSPEPRAYESGFAVKWLIAEQIAGKPDLNYDGSRGVRRAPWLAWGPYLWADGMRARRDGLSYSRSDFLFDGIHPSPSGTQNVARQLLDFFNNEPTSRPWFRVTRSPSTPVSLRGRTIESAQKAGPLSRSSQ